MTTNTNPNPFLNFDFTKMMAGFDATKMADQFKMPGIDLEALMATQQRNFEALKTANRMAMEGFQAVAQRQAEFLSSTVQETQNAFGQVSKSKSPQDAAAKQVDFMKAAYEKSVANFRELTDMSAEIASETTDVINSRISDSLEEMKKTTPKTQKTK